jgi:hypothetical protein
LGTLAALLPLAWLYLRRRQRPPATVSSLVIWRAIARPVVAKREPRLPLLFFIQALLVLAGVMAAAGPYLLKPRPPGPPRDAVVVLDVSASMQAKLDSGTRFEEARDAAVERARQLGADGRRITVIAAGLQPEVVGAGLDGEQAARAIEALAPRDTAGNLTAAAELAATRAGADGSVDLYTDTPIDELVMSRDARTAIAVHRFGTGGANVAVAGVRVQTNPFDKTRPSRILLSVRSFADEPREVGIEIAPLPPTQGAPLARTVTLAPNATEVVAFDQVAWSGPFAARLSVGDDLAVDDVSYGFVPPPRELPVALVTEDATFARAFESLVKKLGSANVKTIAPDAYRPEDSAEITIFDRTAPQIPPAGNVAYLAPRQGNADVTIAPQAGEARFAESRDHEMLRGVQNPDTLLSGRLVGLATGGPLKPIMLGRAEGREVALALAGEVGERRVVATAFPIRPGSLSDADSLPSIVFALNLVRWLSPASSGAPLERLAGERLRAGSAGAPAITRLVGPDGARDLGPTEETPLARAGVYEAVSPGGTRPLLVSFLDPGESDIRRSAQAAAPAPPPTAAAAARQQAAAAAAAAEASMHVPYAHAAVLALVGLMLLEWLVVAATGRRRARANAAGSRAASAADEAAAGAGA